MDIKTAIAKHVPDYVIESAREDGEKLTFRQVNGTVRVSSSRDDDPSYCYRGRRILKLSEKVWAFGLKYNFESLSDAKRFIDVSSEARGGKEKAA